MNNSNYKCSCREKYEKIIKNKNKRKNTTEILVRDV